MPDYAEISNINKFVPLVISLCYLYRPSDRVQKKKGKLCGNFRPDYAEESVDYAEKMPDYAEISNINKFVPLVISNV